MPLLDDVIAFNDRFVTEPQRTVSRVPAKNIVIFTCMDTRVVEFLEPAMGLKRGDANVIKNAGTTVLDPDGGVIRSLAVAVYALRCEEIFVIGHLDCGMTYLDVDKFQQQMLKRGVPEETIASLEPSLSDWLGTFRDANGNVERVVHLLRGNPLIPKDVPVHGLMFDPDTGKLEVLDGGYGHS